MNDIKDLAETRSKLTPTHSAAHLEAVRSTHRHTQHVLFTHRLTQLDLSTRHTQHVLFTHQHTQLDLFTQPPLMTGVPTPRHSDCHCDNLTANTQTLWLHTEHRQPHLTTLAPHRTPPTTLLLWLHTEYQTTLLLHTASPTPPRPR